MLKNFKNALKDLIDLFIGSGLDMDISFRGDRIVVTGGASESSGERRASSRRETQEDRPVRQDNQLPTEDEILTIIRKTKNPTLTSVARKLGVKPRTRLAPLIKSMIRSKTLRKSGIFLRPVIEGEEPPRRGRPKKTRSTSGTTGRRTSRSSNQEDQASEAQQADKPALTVVRDQSGDKEGQEAANEDGGGPIPASEETAAGEIEEDHGDESGRQSDEASDTTEQVNEDAQEGEEQADQAASGDSQPTEEEGAVSAYDRRVKDRKQKEAERKKRARMAKKAKAKVAKKKAGTAGPADNQEPASGDGDNSEDQAAGGEIN